MLHYVWLVEAKLTMLASGRGYEGPCAPRRINKHQELDDLGATGLRSQDSLGITRARLAKQRLNESTALLDDIKNMEVRPCGDLEWSHTWIT